MQRGKAKVKWKEVCVPRSQGGLGIKSLKTWNMTLLSKHIWNIVSKKDSIWVKWVHLCHLQSRNFWEVNIPSNSCWSWRKILQCRDPIRRFIKVRLGDGSNTSVWFDQWHNMGPLSHHLTARNIYESGHGMEATVKDVVDTNGWRWPHAWAQQHASLATMDPPVLRANQRDQLVWQTSSGKELPFSIKSAWVELRESQEAVRWHKWVWFSQCIPRHSFMLWLAFKQKLKTHDKIIKTTGATDMVCPFCKMEPDSHEHLFFECVIPAEVWEEIKCLARMHHAPNKWTPLCSYIQRLPTNKTIWSIIQRLSLGSMVYVIWQERNLRLFQTKNRTAAEMVTQIKQLVRLRLMGLKIKSSPQVLEAAQMWDLVTVAGPYLRSR